MFVRIDNTPRDYAWGSTTAIADLLGRTPSGRPEAELWLGAHPGSPSVILDPASVDGARTLAEWIERDPVRALGPDALSAGATPHLPYLLKVLAADAPLSLQAHPSSQQALAGFERENAAGIPLDAPTRDYKDPFHKPELILALSERFEALCGFRGLAKALADVESLTRAAGDKTSQLRELRRRLILQADAEQVLRGAVGWLLGGGEQIEELVSAATAAARLIDARGEATAGIETVALLADAYPGDPGVVLSLLLNRVTLHRGEALYLPAGNIHAYLSGLGVEVMAASDNVLRGGLTPKYVDVPELLRVLEFTPLPVPYLHAGHPAPGVALFRPDVPDFCLTEIEVRAAGVRGARVALAGAAIVLCTRGAAELSGAHGAERIARGDVLFVTPDEAALTITGDATLFVAMPNP
jgi:mannose-6-phosphate isomerase, class I